MGIVHRRKAKKIAYAEYRKKLKNMKSDESVEFVAGIDELVASVDELVVEVDELVAEVVEPVVEVVEPVADEKKIASGKMGNKKTKSAKKTKSSKTKV